MPCKPGFQREAMNVPFRAGQSRNTAAWTGTRLYWFEEAPAELQYNRFIRSGYRAGKADFLPALRQRRDAAPLSVLARSPYGRHWSPPLRPQADLQVTTNSW